MELNAVERRSIGHSIAATEVDDGERRPATFIAAADGKFRPRADAFRGHRAAGYTAAGDERTAATPAALRRPIGERAISIDPSPPHVSPSITASPNAPQVPGSRTMNDKVDVANADETGN